MRNLFREIVALLKPYKKSFAAGFAAAVMAAVPLIWDGHVSAADASYIVGAFVAAAWPTYKVRNAPVVTGARKAE